MSKAISRGAEGAGLGGTLGFALGTLLSGVTLAIPGLNIVLAPVVLAATAATTTVSCSALGTAVGGVSGMLSGAREDKRGGNC